MAINFVIGAPCAGKSYFIRETFPDARVIDLYDFQGDDCMTIEDIAVSYKEAEDALINAIMTSGRQIVFEHTLVKAI